MQRYGVETEQERHQHRYRAVWFGEEKRGWLWCMTKNGVKDGKKEVSGSCKQEHCLDDSEIFPQ